MASRTTYNGSSGGAAYSPSVSDDERAAGGRKSLATKQPFGGSSLPQLPTSNGLRAPAGGLLKGATDDNGQLKPAGLMVGIKLDLEAEVHLTARIREILLLGCIRVKEFGEDTMGYRFGEDSKNVKCH